MEAIPGGSGKVIILPPYCLYSTTFISQRRSELTWIPLKPNAKMVEILVAREDLSYRRTHGVTICNLISCKLRQCCFTSLKRGLHGVT